MNKRWNLFIKSFRLLPGRYSVATNVAHRNGGASQFKRLSGPMFYRDAVGYMEQVVRQRNQSR